MKQVISPTLFTHIPKSGGTTLYSIIKRNYKDEKFFFISQDHSIQESLGVLEKTKNKAQLIGGHVQFGLHQFLDQPCQYITFLREPIELTLSHYYFFRNKKEYRPAIKKIVEFAKSHSVEEYCRKIHSNAMTRFLSGADFDLCLKKGYLKCLEEKLLDQVPSDLETTSTMMLEEAKHNLKNYFKVFGLTERFDESLLLFKENLAWKNIFYQKKNVTKNRLKSELLSSLVTKELRRCNELDLELYAYGKQLFEELIEKQGRKKIDKKVKIFTFINPRWNQLVSINKTIRTIPKKLL